MFEHYGEIIEVALLKAPSGMSRGCAFVKYGDMAAAEAAVQNLHGNFKMEGGTSALTVKFADSEKEKKKRQKLKQSLGRLNMMGGQMGLPGMGMCGISGGMPGGAGMPGNAIPGGMPGGMGAMGMGAMGMGAMGGMGMGNMAAMGGAGMGGKGGGGGGRPAAPLANIAERKASGPPGANCFILHLPLSWGDEELREVCKRTAAHVRRRLTHTHSTSCPSVRSSARRCSATGTRVTRRASASSRTPTPSRRSRRSRP